MKNNIVIEKKVIKHSGITSGAGSLVTNMLNIQNYSGMNKTQISQAQTFNSLIGGLASNTQIVYTAHKSGMDNAATALRMMYGFGDEEQSKTLEDILQGLFNAVNCI